LPTLATIRTALKQALSSIPDCQVSAYLLAQPTPPCLMVVTGETSYDAAMARGLDRWTLLVQALVPLTVDQRQQELLDRWRSPSGTHSVKAAVETDRTLGGVVQDALVVSASEDRVYGIDPHLSLGCEFVVQLLATGA
jgi:hypothetical protein